MMSLVFFFFFETRKSSPAPASEVLFYGLPTLLLAYGGVDRERGGNKTQGTDGAHMIHIPGTLRYAFQRCYSYTKLELLLR